MAVALCLAALAPLAHGHEFDRTSVEIFFVGNTAKFTVADQEDCSAKITVRVADETIASIDPKDVTGVRQTFTVTALKGGTTTVHVEWHGISPCVDEGSRDVTVVVRSGPDLTIKQDVSGRPPLIMRVGGVLAFDVTFINIGDQPTIGVYSVGATLPPQLLFFLGTEACTHNGQSFDCPETNVIPAGGRRERVVRYLLGAVSEGFTVVAPFVRGGGDIRMSNNDAELVLVGIEPAREGNALPGQDPAKTGGRR